MALGMALLVGSLLVQTEIDGHEILYKSPEDKAFRLVKYLYINLIGVAQMFIEMCMVSR